MEFLKQRGIHCQILNQHGINKSKIKKDANIPEIKCGGGLLENKTPKSMKAPLVIGFVARLHCGWSKLCALTLVLQCNFSKLQYKKNIVYQPITFPLIKNNSWNIKPPNLQDRCLTN